MRLRGYSLLETQHLGKRTEQSADEGGYVAALRSADAVRRNRESDLDAALLLLPDLSE